MKHIAHLVLALAFVLVATRDSSASPPSATAVVFEAVDAVTMNGDTHMVIEGVVEGAAAATTVEFHIATTGSTGSGPSITAITCHQQAMFALSHPGRYALEIDNHTAFPNGSSIGTCTIRRR